MKFLKLICFKSVFGNKIIINFNTSLGLFAIGLNFVTLNTFIMYKGRSLNSWFVVSVYVHIPVSWPDDDPSQGSKLDAS